MSKSFWRDYVIVVPVVPAQLLTVIGKRGVVWVGLVPGTEGLMLIWLLFLRSSPAGVWTTYDLGIPANHMVFQDVLHVVICCDPYICVVWDLWKAPYVMITILFVILWTSGQCFSLKSFRWDHWGTRLDVVWGRVASCPLVAKIFHTKEAEWLYRIAEQ